MKTIKQLLLSLLFIYGGLYSQPLKTQQFTVADGLSANGIQPVLQDRYGLLWIGTANGGLMVYDGYTFKLFKNVPGNPQSILNNTINGLVEDARGTIWIANNGGVSKYIRAQDHFKNYDFEDIFPDKKESFDRTLRFALDANQDLWVSTIGLGMARYDREKDTWRLQKYQSPQGVQEPTDRFIIGCTFDGQNRLWAGVDDFGLMWFDSADSLFKPAVYKNMDRVPNFTRPENMITGLYTDPTGIIWITARNGVYKYNPETHSFKTLATYQIQRLNFFNLFNDILPDNKGNIWVANNFRGVLKFDGISDSFQKINIAGQSFSKDGVTDMRVNTLYFDRSGVMWLGTVAQGLLKHDPQRAAFRLYQHQKNNPESIGSSQVFGLFESKRQKGKIYVGLRGAGLNLFDPIKETFKNIPLSFKKDVFGGSVRVIREGADGMLWLGTWGDGLLKLDANKTVITHFEMDSSRTNSLPDNLVRILERNDKGNYWVGTNAGLCYLDVTRNTLKRIDDKNHRVYPQGLLDAIKQKFKTDSAPIRIAQVGNDADTTVNFQIVKPRNYLIISSGEGSPNDSTLADYGWISDSQGREVWSGKRGDESYYLGGNVKNRFKIDIKPLTPGNYRLRYKSDESHAFGKWNAQPPTYLNFWGIRIIELQDGAETQRFQNYLAEARAQMIIRGRNIRSVHVSKNGIVWVGTDTKGLNRLDLQGRTVKNYAADPAIENTLSDNSIQFIYEDKAGILWLATNGGLNRFDPKTETFKVFSEEDGLPTNYIASILPAEGRNLWLATRNGLSKMVVSSSTGQITFVNYDAEDGLGGTDFIAQVALKSSTGRFYFGGEHGLNVFSPTDENEAPPALYLADIKLGNVSLLSSKSEIHADTALTDLKTLKLPHDKNDLTFAYSALHFSNPAKNQYAHRLNGYDKNWVYDNKRTSTYTNLDPGEYTFSFKGSNRDGVWNEEGKSLSITILPPWWQTWWAYSAYGLIFLGIIFGVDRIQRRRLLGKAREQMRIREMEMRAEAAELQAKAAEAERRALEAENKRKSEELEEARQLQLSMLPKKLPQLPNLDIAVYMQTATEVGGDYYDFHVGLEGTLTVVIGDATGHGMKAGTMVTATKSLFRSYASNPDILFSFKEFTRCIKEMNFGKTSMCLTMLKIKGNKMQMSTAGMPPSFIFRRDTRVVEEHLFKAMPLGTMMKFPYELKDTTLHPGDTILLMSDGLPELLNDKDEMYGYKKIRNGFEDVAEKAPEEIISFLKNEGKAWNNNQAPDDDVTFVVIKVK